VNYVAHYDRLIARARCRELAGYTETHHVLPRSMGGGDEPENLADLTPEEHYVAHQLLVKMHPSAPRLAVAAALMAKRCTGSKAYGWLRRKIAAAMLGRKLAESTIEKLRALRRSEETRRKISASQLGNKHRLGTKQPLEWRARMSAMRKGVKRPPFSAEWREKISAANVGSKRRVGKTHTEETKRRISDVQRGRRRDPVAVEKTAAALRGRKRPPFSPEWRANMSAAALAAAARKRASSDHPSTEGA